MSAKGDDATESIAKFSRTRDEWLYGQALAELTPFERNVANRPVKAKCDEKHEQIVQLQGKVKPIRERIARNKGQQFMEKIVAKNEAEAKQIEEEIASLEAQMKGLADALKDEEVKKKFDEKEAAREADHKKSLPRKARELALSRRSDVSLLRGGYEPLSLDKPIIGRSAPSPGGRSGLLPTVLTTLNGTASIFA